MSNLYGSMNGTLLAIGLAVLAISSYGTASCEYILAFYGPHQSLRGLQDPSDATVEMFRAIDSPSSNFLDSILSPDGARLLLLHEGENLYVWNTVKGAFEARLEQSAELTMYPIPIAFNRDATQILAVSLIGGSEDEFLSTWDVSSGKLTSRLPLPPKVVIHQISEDGQILLGTRTRVLGPMASQSVDDPLQALVDVASGKVALPTETEFLLLSASTGEISKNLGAVTEEIREVVLSPDASLVGISARNRWVRVIRVSDASVLFEKEMNTESGINISYNNRWLYAEERDGPARVFELGDPSGKTLMSLGLSHKAVFSPATPYLAQIAGNSLSVLEPGNHMPSSRIIAPLSQWVTWSNAGSEIFTHIGDRIVAWRATTAEPLYELIAKKESEFGSISYSRLGQVLLFSNDFGSARVWHLEQLKPVITEELSSSEGPFIYRSSDGKYDYVSRIVSGMFETTVSEK